MVEDSIFVAAEELLLELLCVYHGGTFVVLDEFHPAWRHVTMPRANLEVQGLKVTLGATVSALKFVR